MSAAPTPAAQYVKLRRYEVDGVLTMLKSFHFLFNGAQLYEGMGWGVQVRHREKQSLNLR